MIEDTRTDPDIVSTCVVGDTPPNTLGKFLDANGALASLEKETIKFTPPNQLNDKFDCMPLCYREAEIEASWKRSLLSRVFPEQKEYYFESHINRDWKPLMDSLSNIIGIASFTDLSQCDLRWMWNRYGDGHKGCLILFDALKMGTFFRVKYSERPKISIPSDAEKYPVDEVLAVLTTKEFGTSDHWEKESEWRMIEHLSKLTPKGNLFLRSYSNAFIKVICGYNMNEVMFNRIVEMVDGKGILVEREMAMCGNG